MLFPCSLHKNQILVLCVHNGCSQRFLCINCIKNGHPHDDSNFKNILDLRELQQFAEEIIQNQNKDFVVQFDKVNRSIKDLFGVSHEDFLLLDDLLEEIRAITAKINDLYWLIKQDCERLVTNINAQKDFNMFELSEIVMHFVDFLELQNKVDKLQEEAKMCFRGIKNICFKNGDQIQAAVIKIIRKNDQQHELQKPKQENFEHKANNNLNKDCLMEIEKTVNQDTVSNSGKENLCQNELKNQMKEANTIRIKNQQLTKEVSEKLLREPNQIVERTDIDSSDFAQKLKDFFESDSKQSISTFEKWFQKAKKHSLSSEILQKLEFERITIQMFRKKTKKHQSITSINKKIDEFLIDLEGTGSKLNFQHLQERICEIKQNLIGQFDNWLSEKKLQELINRMKDSQVIFWNNRSQLINDLENFKSFWEKIQDQIKVDKIKVMSFTQIESIIQELWKFRIKMPQMKRILIQYMESKELIFHSEYLRLRLSKLNEDLKWQNFDIHNDCEILKELQEIENSPEFWSKKRGYSGNKSIFLAAGFESTLDLISAEAKELSNKLRMKKSGNHREEDICIDHDSKLKSPSAKSESQSSIRCDIKKETVENKSSSNIDTKTYVSSELTASNYEEAKSDCSVIEVNQDKTLTILDSYRYKFPPREEKRSSKLSRNHNRQNPGFTHRLVNMISKAISKDIKNSSVTKESSEILTSK